MSCGDLENIYRSLRRIWTGLQQASSSGLRFQACRWCWLGPDWDRSRCSQRWRGCRHHSSCMIRGRRTGYLYGSSNRGRRWSSRPSRCFGCSFRGVRRRACRRPKRWRRMPTWQRRARSLGSGAACWFVDRLTVSFCVSGFL